MRVQSQSNIRFSPYSHFPGMTPVGTSSATSVSGANDGSTAASNVTATLSISPSNNATLFNIFASPGTVSMISATEAEWTIGDVNPGQSYFIGFEVSASASGSYTSTIHGMTSSPQTTTNDDTQSATVTFTPGVPLAYIYGVQTTEAEPVSTFSGKEVFTEPPDLNLEGPLGLFFQRHYDGALAEDGVINSALGPNWQHNYDITLAVNGTNATVGFLRGRILRFANDGTNWNLTARTDIPFQLVESGADFILADPRSQFMYSFNAGGLLTCIEDGRGNTNFLSYDGTLLTNVTDGLNRQLTLQYDGSGQLTNVTDGTRAVQLLHGSPLAGAMDALGHLTSYDYITNGSNTALLTARTRPEGNTPFAQVYNGEGRVSAQTDGAGNTTKFTYLPAFGGYQTVITNPLGDFTTHFYTGTGEFSQFTDEAGNSILLQQEFNTGRRSVVRDRFNNQTRLFYNATNGFPNRIDLQSNADEFLDYAPRVVNGITFLDLIRARHPDGTTNAFAHDAQGDLISQTNRTGDVWTYGRNNRGQLLAITNPLGGTAAFGYDGNARLASSTDSGVGVTTYEYDSLNRLTKVTHPHPDTVQFVWDALNRLVSVTDERTNTTTFEYDGNSRLTNVLDALGQAVRFQYDDVDRLVRTVDRLGNATQVGYEPRSLLSSITNRNGLVTRFVHDERRRLTGIVSPANTTNAFGYDDEGLFTSASNPLGETVSFQRDAMGYVTNLFDPLNHRTTFALDAMKRITNVTDSVGRKASFAYNRSGLLTNVTREAGIAATYRRNALGLVTNITDPKSSQWQFAHTSAGRLTDFTDPLSRSTSYERDARGRIVRVAHADGVGQTNIYDGANNLLQTSFSDGTLFQFAYDALNRLTNAAASPAFAFEYDAEDRLTNTRQEGLDFDASYDADGRLTSVSYSNGFFVVNYTHDSRDRLIGVSDNLTGQGMGFTYDAADRLTGITRSNGVNASFTYDVRGLTTRIEEGSILDLRYTYDAAGQVTEADYVNAPIDPSTVVSNATANFTYDVASQISSGGHQFDARGRLTNSPSAALQWDGASRLLGIGAVSLAYNALDDVVTRTEGGVTNRFFYNYALRRLPIVAERNDNTGQFTRFHVWSPGGVLLYMVNLPANTVSYPHFDRVGSTLALTDNSGAVTDAYAYEPYGRLIARTGTSDQPFQFVGRSGVRVEPAAGLFHMRARYYDPQTARWLSPEPLWPDLLNPVRLNPYQYAMRNPLDYVDPQGTDEEQVEKPVKDMNAKELQLEIFSRRVEQAEQRLNRRLTPDEAKRLAYNVKEQVRRLKRQYSDWLDMLRKRVQDMRDEAKRAAEFSPRDDDDEEEGGVIVTPPPFDPLLPRGGAVLPGGDFGPPSPAPVPLPPVEPQGPSGESEKPGADHHGFLFGSADGIPVSFQPPDAPGPLPLSPKARGLIDTAVKYQMIGERGPIAGPGDYNGDGVVDARDFVHWRKTGGSAEDYNTWRENFGSDYREFR